MGRRARGSRPAAWAEGRRPLCAGGGGGRRAIGGGSAVGLPVGRSAWPGTLPAQRKAVRVVPNGPRLSTMGLPQAMAAPLRPPSAKLSTKLSTKLPQAMAPPLATRPPWSSESPQATQPMKTMRSLRAMLSPQAAIEAMGVTESRKRGGR